MNNLEKKEQTKPEKVKKTYAVHREVAQLIETHKYGHRGREIDFVSQAIRSYCAKIAVELGIINHMLAAGYVDLTDSEIAI